MNGLRIIRRSPAGTAAQLGVGIAVGVGLIFGIWLPIAYLVPTRLGVTDASVLLGMTIGFLAYFAVLIPVSPYIRKLAGWHPEGPFVRLEVVSASLGRLRHELHLEGDGQEVWVRTTARRGTITAALLLAHQMPHDPVGRGMKSLDR